MTPPQQGANTMDTTPTPAHVRAGRIADLRDIADWLEAHPDVPVPTSLYGSAFDDPTIAAVCCDDNVAVIMHPTPVLVRRFSGVVVRWTSDGNKLTDGEYRPATPRALTPAQLRDRSAVAR